MLSPSKALLCSSLSLASGSPVFKVRGKFLLLYHPPLRVYCLSPSQSLYCLVISFRLVISNKECQPQSILSLCSGNRGIVSQRPGVGDYTFSDPDSRVTCLLYNNRRGASSRSRPLITQSLNSSSSDPGSLLFQVFLGPQLSLASSVSSSALPVLHLCSTRLNFMVPLYT